MIVEPLNAVFALVFVIQPINWNYFAARQFSQQGMFQQTGFTPRGPYIEQPNLAAQIFRRNSLGLIMQLRQAEHRRWLADQRRGNFPRVE